MLLFQLHTRRCVIRSSFPPAVPSMLSRAQASHSSDSCEMCEAAPGEVTAAMRVAAAAHWPGPPTGTGSELSWSGAKFCPLRLMETAAYAAYRRCHRSSVKSPAAECCHQMQRAAEEQRSVAYAGWAEDLMTCTVTSTPPSGGECMDAGSGMFKLWTKGKRMCLVPMPHLQPAATCRCLFVSTQSCHTASPCPLAQRIKSRSAAVRSSLHGARSLCNAHPWLFPELKLELTHTHTHCDSL